MSDELNGKTIAFLIHNSGVEQVELTRPWQAVIDAGGRPVLVAPEAGKAQAFNNDVEKADTFDVDVTVSDASPADYDALVLPGGTTNPDHLRTIPEAVAFATAFVDARKPVAAICHGPWTLVEAGVLGGKTLTSWPSLHTDIVNAGAHEWVDQEVVVCPEQGWTLVTSRNPDDLDAFCSTIVEQFAGSAVAS